MTLNNIVFQLWAFFHKSLTRTLGAKARFSHMNLLVALVMQNFFVEDYFTYFEVIDVKGNFCILQRLIFGG